MKKFSLKKTSKAILLLVDRKFYPRFFIIQLLIIISCVMETLSFFSILPLVNLMAQPESTSNWVGLFFYKLSGLQSIEIFIFYSAIFILGALILSLILTILRMWFMTLFANQIGFNVGDSLFSYYLKKGYKFHVIKNSSYLTKQITVEAIRVKNMMKALMQLNSDLFMLIIILSGLVYYNPRMTLILAFVIGLIYIGLYLFTSNILLSSGRNLSDKMKERFKIINNSFGGISDIIMAGCNEYFIAQMRNTGKALAHATTLGQVFALAPARIMQTTILIALVSVVLYFSVIQGDITRLVITASAFIMAGYKILPLFQSIYASTAVIKTNSPAIEAIYQDLSDDFNQAHSKDLKTAEKMLGDIVLENVSFTHPGSATKTIRSVNAIIKTGQKVGIIGPTGSGKSTLINLITSLIAPESGALKVGGVTIDASNEHIWKNSVALIAQNIFLIDGTIAENIAFGIDAAEIDIDKVERCVLKANIESYLATLPKGIQTEVGERGIQLSGGQKQRVGIARALYCDVKYLIMDEGTSSLDQDTERLIINGLTSVDKDLTVIMIAHRLNTLSECDSIYALEHGAVVAQGTYKNIIENRDPKREDRNTP